MAEHVGFDPETGLLTPEKPQMDKDPFILEDGKKISLAAFLHAYCYYYI